MDNDILINQARQLYAVLLVKQFTMSIESKAMFERLGRLVMWANCRYQRRLNRCVLCYQDRSYDCIREAGKKHIPCLRRKRLIRIDDVNQSSAAFTQC